MEPKAIPEHQKLPKMVIVMRTDLNMRKGKMAAQAGHAASMFLVSLTHLIPTVTEGKNTFALGNRGIDLTEEQGEWLRGSYAKICVGINSEEELLALHEKAKEQGLTSYRVLDNGHTEFGGVQTHTCIAIGPHYPERFQGLTDHLKLL